MNFFKKALVASAVTASFGATAATVVPSTTALKLSAEGVAAGVAAYAGDFDFNVTIGAEHPAGATVTLTFSDGVSIDAANVANTVDNSTPQAGDAGSVIFDYGNGSFTFDNVTVVDGDQTKGESDSISFDISLGQPLNKNAAFNVEFTGATVSKGSTADYVAEHAGNTIDTGTGVVAAEMTQFAFAVKTPLDGIINRTDDTVYTDTTEEDALVVNVTNYEDLEMSVTPTVGDTNAYTAVVKGTFTNVTNGEVVVTGGTNSAATVNGGMDFITVGLTDDVAALTNGAVNPATVTVNHAGSAIPVTGDVEVDFQVNSADFTSGKLVLGTAVPAGEWKVDATIINVPYLPVGKEGTSSSVHLANESGVAVDVIVSAIDQNGTVYPAMDLGLDLPKQTVTKVSQTMLMDLFSIDAGAVTKLSVTFNVDANEGVVNGYAFTTDDTGRTEISTSQQRGN